MKFTTIGLNWFYYGVALAQAVTSYARLTFLIPGETRPLPFMRTPLVKMTDEVTVMSLFRILLLIFHDIIIK